MKYILLLFISTNCLFAQGMVLWDENLHGPLSNDYGTATHVGNVSAGTNVVTGSSEWLTTDGGASGGITGDFFILTTPSSLSLLRINLVSDRAVDVVIADSTFSTLFAFAIKPSNGDLLSQVNLVSLPPGTYGLSIKNADLGFYSTTAHYQLDFIASPIPEPST